MMQKHHVLSYPHNFFNGTHNSSKLKNQPHQVMQNSFLSTGVAEFFIFVVLRVRLDF